MNKNLLRKNSIYLIYSKNKIKIMAWLYHDGTKKLSLEKGSKVKTQLTPFKCSLGETVENDKDVSFKKIWIVEEVLTSSIILKSGNNTMETNLNGFAIDDWIHHRIYKIQE